MASSAATKVAINLTRLISPSQGAGGAGWFALHFAKASGLFFDTLVFVRPENREWIARALAGGGRIRTRVMRDFEKEAYGAIEAVDVYLDPLNGLEPAVLPPTTTCIATIHDLLFRDHPEFFDQKELIHRSDNYGSSIARADVVLTVSEDQRRKIVDTYGKSDVRTIPQPPYFSPSTERTVISHDQDTSFIFYPSVQWNHKNHYRLYQAFLHLCEVNRIPENVRLVVSRVAPVESNTGLHRNEAHSRASGNRIVELPYLDNDQYANVLAKTLGVVYPSVYEGYGIPTVEALMNGIPVLASDVPALEMMQERPDHLFRIRDPENAAMLSQDLEKFILTAKRSSVRPDLSLATEESFQNDVRELIEYADSRRSRRNRLAAGAYSRLSKKRLINGITAHVIASSSQDLAGLEAKLAGQLDTRIKRVVIHTAIADAMKLPQDRKSWPEVRWAFHHGDPESADRTLLYELVFNTTKMAAIISDGPNLVDELQLSCEAIDVIAGSSGLNAARIGASLLGGPLLRALGGRVLEIDRLKLPLNATVEMALERAETRLTEPINAGARKLIIVDPSLKDAIGHHIGVARAMARGARDLGFKPLVLANRVCPPGAMAPDCATIPGFSDYLYGGVADIGLFAHELKQAVKRQYITSRDMMTLFCATPAMLAGSIAFLLDLKPSVRPRIAIRFDRDEARAPTSRIGYEKAFHLIKAFDLRKQYNFFVESKGLQDYFYEMSGERFPLLFNPLPDFAGEFAKAGFRLTPPEGGASEKITFGYLGEARVEKGFHVLPFLIEYLGNHPETKGKVAFQVQCGASHQNQHGWVLSARDQLRHMALTDSSITLYDFLSEDEYQRVLTSVDVLMLPYGPDNYTRRGSGVATEALAAGKAIMVSRGTDIAATYEGAGVVQPGVQNEEGLAEACLRAFREVDALHAKSRAFCAAHPEYVVDDRRFVQRFTELEVADSGARGCVLWISNDTRGQGSQTVYDAQIDYLKSRGYTPIELHIPYPNRHNAEIANRPAFDWGALLDQLQWRPGFTPEPAYFDVVDRFEQVGNSYTNFTNAWRHLEFPEKLQELILSLDFAMIIVNYAHHRAVLDTLDLRDPKCPVIVETHDLQAIQYAIQQGREPDASEIAQEFAALKKFDHLVSISASEAETFRQSVDANKVSWALPPACTAKSRVEAGAPPELVDLLIVASEHDANVASVRWFLSQVYKPWLYDKGITLSIVGSVRDRLDTGYLADRINYTGVVDDLGPYYKAAKVVVLPITSGAGVPIKVLDCFFRGAAFSLTSYPVAAMNLPPDFPVVRSGPDMGKDILALLADEAKRRERAQLGQAFYVAHSSRHAYFRTWDNVLRQVGLEVEGPLPDPNEGIVQFRPLKTIGSGASGPAKSKQPDHNTAGGTRTRRA